MIRHHRTDLTLVHNMMNLATLFTYPALGQGCKKGDIQTMFVFLLRRILETIKGEMDALNVAYASDINIKL